MWSRLFHIETLFFILVLVIILYFIFCGEKKRAQFFTHLKKFQTDNNLVEKNTKRKNVHEEKCRSIFEARFKCKFPTVRPNWLKNPATGKNLELDGYNENVKTPIGKGLAFEYDGIQHAKYTKHFHKKGAKEFVYQTRKDRFKDYKCKERDIILIRIPHHVHYDDLDEFVNEKIDRVFARSSSMKR